MSSVGSWHSRRACSPLGTSENGVTFTVPRPFAYFGKMAQGRTLRQLSGVLLTRLDRVSRAQR
jgi:hypothetical protein